MQVPTTLLPGQSVPDRWALLASHTFSDLPISLSPFCSGLSLPLWWRNAETTCLVHIHRYTVDAQNATKPLHFISHYARSLSALLVPELPTLCPQSSGQHGVGSRKKKAWSGYGLWFKTALPLSSWKMSVCSCLLSWEVRATTPWRPEGQTRYALIPDTQQVTSSSSLGSNLHVTKYYAKFQPVPHLRAFGLDYMLPNGRKALLYERQC